MANKENQELMHKLCNEILTTIQFNTNRDVITGLQKAIDDLELKDKALDKACEKLGDNHFGKFILITEKFIALNKEQWKECLLKEVQDEQV